VYYFEAIRVRIEEPVPEESSYLLFILRNIDACAGSLKRMERSKKSLPDKADIQSLPSSFFEVPCNRQPPCWVYKNFESGMGNILHQFFSNLAYTPTEITPKETNRLPKCNLVFRTQCNPYSVFSSDISIHLPFFITQCLGLF
jgi:hypothetical protein